MTFVATIAITVEVDAEPTDAVRAALGCLADVMAVQAEDGLYSLGSPESENDDGPSEFVADLTTLGAPRITLFHDITKES